MGSKKCPPRGTPAVLSGVGAGPEGSQKAPQGSPDDGSEAFPKFSQIFDDFGLYFSSENDPENEPNIIKKYVQIMKQNFR